MKDFKLIIKNKYFIRLWVSQILSQYTINILNFLFLLKIFQQTNSPIAVSMLWVIYSLPSLLIGPFSSTFIDVADKRKILILSNLFQFSILLLYSFVYLRNFYFIYVAAFSYSFLNQFYIPAESASIPRVVDKKNLAYANSLFFSTQQSSIIFGYGSSGLLSHHIGFQNTCFLCAGMLFIASISVYKLPKMKSEETLGKELDEMIERFLINVKKGYEMIKNNKNILLPICIMLFGQSALVIVTLYTPFITQQILRTNPAYSGVLIVIPASIGAIISSVYISRRIRHGERKKKIILRSLFILSILTISINVIALINDLYIRIIMGIVIIFLIGVFFVQILIPAQTFLQESTPANFRGRVFGNYWVLSTLLSFFPILILATFSEFFGIRSLTILLSMVCLLVFYLSKKDKHSILYE